MRVDQSEVVSAAVKRTTQMPLRRLKNSQAPPLNAKPAVEALCAAGLFAGIGGIEQGISRAGHRAALLCEIEVTANAVLDAHFPDSKRVADVRQLRVLPREVDLVTAGFPCQDLSQAGRTIGIHGERSGLVGEIFRLLENRAAEWVVLENVPFMLQLGKGRALDVIMAELESLGYMWAYRVINSRAFGLPQRRERIYVVASRHHDPRNVLLVDEVSAPTDLRTFREVACGFYWTEGLRGLGWAIDSVPTLKGGSTIGIPSPPAIIFPNGQIVKPDIRDAERLQGFPADWTEPAERVGKRASRWKLVGNAVTVDAAEWLGQRLRNPGEYDPSGDAELRKGERWPLSAWNLGHGRFAADLTTWPMQRAAEPLETFLRYPTESLSEKATRGFLSRAKVARLRFPDGFIEAMEQHLSCTRLAVASSKTCPGRVEEPKIAVA